MPRASQQWPRPLSPLVVDAPVPSAPIHDPNGTVRTLAKTPHLEVMPEGTPPPVVNNSAQTTSVWVS